jgi:hypothetical protein
VDRTGLDGIYDFSLRLFDPDSAKSETDPKGDMLQQLDNGLNASLKALGLKLEPQKTFEKLARTTEPGSAEYSRVPGRLEGRAGPVRASIEILVIDRVEKPSGN